MLKVDALANTENKLLNVYLGNFYYSFVCDHANTIKSSKLGLSLLANLIVREIEVNLAAKFNFNQAFSFYIQHKFTEAIESFTKVIKVRTSLMIL